MSAPEPPKSASKQIEIVNRRGLHARASAMFVKLAATFEAEIVVSKDGIEVVASTGYVPELLFPKGILTKKKPQSSPCFAVFFFISQETHS